MKSQAFLDGIEAHKMGDDSADNPYDYDTREGKDWHKGWMQQHAKRKSSTDKDVW